MKPLDPIAKRDLLAAERYDANRVQEYAEDFLSERRLGDALEFFRKLEDEAGVRRVLDAAIEDGDPDILWRVRRHFPHIIKREDWLTAGDNAMELGRFRCAAYIFQQAGDADRRAVAEAKFKPTEPDASEPESPDPA